MFSTIYLSASNVEQINGGVGFLFQTHAVVMRTLNHLSQCRNVLATIGRRSERLRPLRDLDQFRKECNLVHVMRRDHLRRKVRRIVTPSDPFIPKDLPWLLPSRKGSITVETINCSRKRILTMFATNVRRNRNYARKGAIRTSNRLFVTITRPLTPRNRIVSFTSTPFHINTFAFPITPRISRRSVVTRTTVRFRVQRTRKTILMRTISRSSHLVKVVTILGVYPTGCHPILTISPSQFPTPFLFPLPSHERITTIILSARGLIPKHVVGFFVDRITGMDPSTTWGGNRTS